MNSILEKTVVIQNFPIWLTQTQTWLYNQVMFASPDIENHIVCERTENLDQFVVPNIHSLSEGSKFYYYWDNGMRRVGLRRHYGLIRGVANETGARILHSHFGDVGWRNLAAARKSNLRHVVTFYGYDVNLLPKQDKQWLVRYRQLFDNVATVLCEGSFMAKSIAKLGCSEEKIIVNHLGIELGKIPFLPRSRARNEPLRVLIAASFREKKGIPYAIAALGALKKQVPVEVTIIGDAGPGAHFQVEKRKIIDEIDRQGLRKKVRLLGYQPYSKLIEEAYKHHVFLSPSVTASDGDTEGGAPVTIIEMAASGMVVVSSKHCDIPEVIHDGEMGLLAEERNIDELSNKLVWLVEHPDKWKEMQLNARSHIEKEYDAAVQGKKLSAIYRKLVQ